MNAPLIIFIIVMIALAIFCFYKAAAGFKRKSEQTSMQAPPEIIKAETQQIPHKIEEYGRCRLLKPWREWDYNIHSDDSQIKRQGYAMTYPFTFEINTKMKSARFSSTSDLPYYQTSLSTCNCHDFQERQQPCKHIYRLAVELGIIEIFQRQSFDADTVAEIKESDDVDAHPEQVKRQKSSKNCKPISIDYENRTAVFTGSGKKPYDTTVDSCTCRDYFVRRLPCKHIYRLRNELENKDL